MRRFALFSGLILGVGMAQVAMAGPTSEPAGAVATSMAQAETPVRPAQRLKAQGLAAASVADARRAGAHQCSEGR